MLPRLDAVALDHPAVALLRLQTLVGNRAIGSALARRRLLTRQPVTMEAQASAYLKSGPELLPPANWEASASYWRLTKELKAEITGADLGGNESDRLRVLWALDQYRADNTVRNLVVHLSKPGHLAYVRLIYLSNAPPRAEVFGTDGPSNNPAKPDEEAPLISEIESLVPQLKVLKGDRDWTAPELVKLKNAISRLSAEELIALKGVQVTRCAKLTGSSGDADDSTTLAKFDDKTEVAKLLVADACFAQDNSLFAGGSMQSRVSASVRTLVHEMGHAVESQLVRDHVAPARRLTTGLIEKVSAAQTTAYAALKELKTTVDALQRSAPGAEQLKQAYQAVESLGLRPRSGECRATAEAVVEMAAVAVQSSDAPAAAESSAVLQRLHKTAAAVFMLADLEAAMATAQEAEGKLSTLYQRRPADSSAMVSSREAALRALGEKKSDIYSVTRYVKRRFESKVAKKKWEAASELYADAFATYKTDPEFLRTQYPDLFEFFKERRHLEA